MHYPSVRVLKMETKFSSMCISVKEGSAKRRLVVTVVPTPIDSEGVNAAVCDKLEYIGDAQSL